MKNNTYKLGSGTEDIEKTNFENKYCNWHICEPKIHIFFFIEFVAYPTLQQLIATHVLIEGIIVIPY